MPSLAHRNESRIEALENEVFGHDDGLEDKTNDELREILDANDLSTDGNKADLVARIRDNDVAVE